MKTIIIILISVILIFFAVGFVIDNHIQNINSKTTFIDSEPFIKVSEGVNYNLQTGEIVLFNENKTIIIK